MGLPKIGKTTIAAQLPNSLIVTFEKGTKYISHPSVAEVSNVPDLRILLKEVQTIQSSDKPFDFCVLDTVSTLERILNLDIASEHGVTSIEEMAYGAGYGALRSKLLTVIGHFERMFKHLVILGHLKKKFIERTNGKLNTEFEVELTGKLAPIFMAEMDTIGLLFREGGEVYCRFLEASEDNQVIIGSRLNRLDGETIQMTNGVTKEGLHIADWSKIFV